MQLLGAWPIREASARWADKHVHLKAFSMMPDKTSPVYVDISDVRYAQKIAAQNKNNFHFSSARIFHVYNCSRLLPCFNLLLH